MPVPDGSLPLEMVSPRRPTRPVVVVRGPGVFAAWMGFATVVSAAVGTLLGLLAASEAGVGGGRWSEVVQAHGRLQLFAFAAPFIAALVMEFMPRLNQQPAMPLRVRAGVPGALAAGALALGAGQVFELSWQWWVLPASLVLAGGTGWFAVVVAGFPALRPAASDPQPLFFRAGAMWLAAAALVGVWGIAAAEARVVPLDLSEAMSEVFLRGFVTLTIAAVALRAFPGHLGVRPMGLRLQWIVFGGINASLVAWMAAAGLGELPRLGWVLRGADLGFAAMVLTFTAGVGVFAGLRGRVGGPRYEVLVPLAWLGAVAFALMLVVAALSPGGDEIRLYRDGAIRHIYMLGFMAPLMVAMAHIVLARFGTGRIPWENALTVAFVLLMAAWPMRVWPVLFADAPSEAGKMAMSAAGGLAMVGLALAAAVCLRTAAEVRRAHQGSRL